MVLQLRTLWKLGADVGHEIPLDNGLSLRLYVMAGFASFDDEYCVLITVVVFMKAQLLHGSWNTFKYKPKDLCQF